MSDESGLEQKVAEALRKIQDFLNEQKWYQDLRAKWEELDPQSRQYVSYGVLGGSSLLLLWFVFSGIYSVYSLRSDYLQKAEIVSLIESAKEEIRKNQSSSGATEDDQLNWSEYLTARGEEAGISGEAISVSKERPGKSNKTSKESLLDVELKKINIKQVVRYALRLETGTYPMKIRHLSIQTVGSDGYLDAQLAVSAFVLKK